MNEVFTDLKDPPVNVTNMDLVVENLVDLCSIHLAMCLTRSCSSIDHAAVSLYASAVCFVDLPTVDLPAKNLTRFSCGCYAHYGFVGCGSCHSKSVCFGSRESARRRFYFVVLLSICLPYDSLSPAMVELPAIRLVDLPTVNEYAVGLTRSGCH